MRRVHVKQIHNGPVALDDAQARHLRAVLRLQPGDRIEVFDDQGASAIAVLGAGPHGELVANIDRVLPTVARALEWTIAAAIPKGPRVDWMIEKLSELGTAVFVPLATARGVVLPEGNSKRQRWARLATQAAEQSHRAGVMQISELIDLPQFLATLAPPAWYLTTGAAAQPISRAVAEVATAHPSHLTMLIGPEGGWTDQEIELMNGAGLSAISLGPTIMRIETAAIVAAAIVATIVAPAISSATTASEKP